MTATTPLTANNKAVEPSSIVTISRVRTKQFWLSFKLKIPNIEAYPGGIDYETMNLAKCKFVEECSSGTHISNTAT